MDENRQQLLDRLQKVWEKADFFSFFEKCAPRPPHAIKKGTSIFNQGDPLERLYFIKDGFVKLYQVSKEGRGTVSYLLGSGYILGIRALTSEDECAKHNAEALTDLQVITMSHKEYFQCVMRQPEILIDLLHSFIDRLNYTERKLEGFMLTDATARVAYFLADTARRFCSKKDLQQQSMQLPLRLTHQLIADFVGSFRETVTISANKLIGEKVIVIDKGIVTILNLPKLKQYALLD